MIVNIFLPINTLTLNAFPWIQSFAELFTFAYFMQACKDVAEFF